MPTADALTLGSIASAEAARQHPALKEWLEPGLVRENILREMHAGSSPEPFPPGGEPTLVETPAGPAVVAVETEPHPRTGEPVPVYVVLGRAGDFPDAGSLTEFAAAVFRTRPVADAREVKLYWPAPAQPDLRELAKAHAEVRPGKRLFAYPAAALHGLPLPRNAERVRIERATDLGFYDEYARQYAQWHSEQPQLARHVRVEPREALERHMADGLLFLAFIDGRIGGVMACFGGRCERGLRGYRMAEEFLYAEFRGQGLAAAMQRRCINALDGAAGQIVFGWIHPLNSVSLRTATRVGRVDVGGYFYVRPLSAARP